SAIDATSGIARIVYRIDGGVWTNYSGFFVVSEGTHTIDFFAIDLAGITEGIHSITLDVDTTAPSSTAALSGRSGTNGWYISNVTVFLNASDATSGVATVTYRVDQGVWRLYLVPFVLSEGEHQIDFFATDVAGNEQAFRSITVAVDTIAPSSIADLSGQSGANGWFVSNVSVSLNASDATSGVAAIWYRVDSGGWTLFAGPFVLTEGRHSLDYYAVDRAGNAEAVNSVDIGIDTTAPTTSASLSG